MAAPHLGRQIRTVCAFTFTAVVCAVVLGFGGIQPHEMQDMERATPVACVIACQSTQAEPVRPGVDMAASAGTVPVRVDEAETVVLVWADPFERPPRVV